MTTKIAKPRFQGYAGRVAASLVPVGGRSPENGAMGAGDILYANKYPF